MTKAKAKTTIPEITETQEILEGVRDCEKTRRELWVEMERARIEHKEAVKAYEAACQAGYNAAGVLLEKHPLFDVPNGGDGEQETEA